MKNFSDFQLPKALADSLAAMKFETPTPIQSQAIPHALEGRDVMGSAQTGTGKTAAFMIPVLAKLLEDPTASALIMSPTRELASQIMDMTHKLMGQKSGIRTALLIGGDPMFKQNKQLSARPRIIIGTPGRIDDHCRRNRSLLDTTNMLVLDEADRMLDMGFSSQIDSILKYMPDEKHTLMFSATFSDKIIKFAQRYLNNPVRVAVKPEKITADKIKHEVIQVKSREDKYERLLSELETREGSVIIFVKTRRNADQLSKRLCDIGNDNVQAQPIHGDLRQRQRDRTIKDFQSKRFRILVATDVASRGLDIPHIEHVINFDLPQNPEDYVHRIGRTARAGAEGNAVCFVTPSDGRDWSEIERMVFPNQAPTFYNDNAGFKKSGGKGRGKPSFRSNGGGQGNKFGKPRSDRPQGDRPKWSGEKSESRDARPARTGERSEGSSYDRPKKRFDRPDNRSENRTDNRNDRPVRKFGADNRPDNRGERSDRPQRPFDRSENRFEARGEKSDRPARKFGADNRSENRSDKPKFDHSKPRGERSENRFEARGERSDRPARKFGADNRPDNRGERSDRPQRPFDRSENRGNRQENSEARPDNRGNRFEKNGFQKRATESRTESRTESNENRTDKRTPRSEGFKKAEGFKKSGGFKKKEGFKSGGEGFAKRKDGFKKSSGSFKKAV